ncbi:anoctamin-3-like, partial [Epargyreus clarus]|uniref:anoctamin-3-like n=1 Tax=Epargyreus clarus TaxID=520877 RepID=UPI003C2E54C4
IQILQDVELTGFFSDGKKRIDIVLVMEEGNYEEKIDKIKVDFLINVIKIGLEIEVEAAVVATTCSDGDNNKIKTFQNRHHAKLRFIKIHAPNALIEEYGIYYNVRKYFKEIHNQFINPHQNLLGMKSEKQLIKTVRKYYPGPLNYSNVERSTIVYHILLSLPFGNNGNFVGLERLIERNIIVDAYALHDGPYFFPRNQIPIKLNSRQVLFYNWVGKRNIFKRQPLHLIREYLGEKVAFYFACYEFFNIALIFAMALGVYITIEGLYDIDDDGVIEEACKENSTNSDNIKKVCPLCWDFNVCPFRNLTDFCAKVTIINFIDNPWTMIHCILISLWAILFILLWRRRKNYLSWLWEYDKTDSIKATRSEFQTDVNNIKTSKLTGIVTDTDSISIRTFRLLLTVSALVMWVLLVMAIAIILHVWKYLLSAEFYKINKAWRDYLAVITVTSINVFIMNILQIVSRSLSYQLTRFENHKTNNSFESSLIIKLFGFGFNCYFSRLISYYFLNVLYTYPSDKSRWYMFIGIGMVNCGPESCLDELCVALVVTILFKEYINKLPAVFLNIKTDFSSSTRNLPCWEREYLLQPLTESVLIEKFCDLVLKFTLVGLFGTIFPLIPVLLFISGILNIRYEARLFLVGSRRPLLRQPTSQHIWLKIMFAIVYTVPCFNTVAMTWMTTMLHYTRTDNVTSYFMSSMGTFVTEDYKKVTGPGSPAEALENYEGFVPAECLFPGLRFRSKNLDGEYYPIERFWRTKYDKHLLMLEVEHVALLLMIILHCAIPSHPRDVSDTIAIEEKIKSRRRIEKIK